MHRPLIFLVCACLAVLSHDLDALAGGDAEAQRKPISGSVVDATGGVIAGATVILRSGPVTERTTTTDAAGRFSFDNVAVGPATITVTFDRFTPVTVDVDRARSELRLVLEPLPISESVSVHASSTTIPRTTSATKTDTPLRDIPQAVSVIGRDLIADQAMQSMADVVRYVPGVGMAQGEGNRDTPIFRGNSSTSDFFVDGVRDDVQYFRDLYNVERVEALKGPNAMIFGRGGVGGVINRVTRQAGWTSSRELTLQTGSWANRRITGDLGQAVNATAAFRITGLLESSETYRSGVDLDRYGVNPTAAFVLGPNTTLRAGYELFHDDRTADRGIPSFQGRPVATDASTFFGNPDLSNARVTVNVASSVLEHRVNGKVTLRNRISYGDYDKFYQNVFPGAVVPGGAAVNLSAYNNATVRRNLFNQTDVVITQGTGRFEHTLLAGVELGRQVTDNRRLTGYFTTVGPTVTSIALPIDDATTSLPVEFRASATDADNHGTATVAAIYVQDQVALSQHVQAIVGLRYDSFHVGVHNNRTASDFSSRDGLVSPRAGVVYKPIVPMSIYASYSLAYLPRAGEQLSSLSLSNQSLEPEEFRNYEVGAKWDIAPALAFTAAAYRLDRGNVAVADPIDPTILRLVDGHRTKGIEIGLSGRVSNAWSIVGGYAWQHGEITQSLAATAQAGARLAQLPEHTFSLWNKYDVSKVWGVGLGLVHRSDIFTSTDNTVTLPAFTRVDAALFFNLTRSLRAQLNVENLLDEAYYASAHNNNNITPGSPRGVRFAVITRF